jgi:Nucleoside-diphosphate-sugar pyrophosphorylase involved in lipopolysaccharide biosynthesis/translation initiation factor 2B, gamma/epsilon subunits (eIF-2Bgamma/eIF-2Bepsilon)
MDSFYSAYKNRKKKLNIRNQQNGDSFDITITQNHSISDAMKLIDSTGLRLCLVCDAENRIIGLVTDGDIRRGLLNNLELSSPINSIMRRDFHYVVNNSGWELEVDFLACAYNLECIPVLDSKGRLYDLVFPDRHHSYKERDNIVIIMAGGLGTRLHPLTVNCPKPLLPIGSRPILERIIIYFKYYGFRNFYISIGYLGHMISDYFGNGENLGVNIQYLQEAKRRGTAGSLSLLPARPSLPFIVTNGDLIMHVNVDEFLDSHMKNDVVGTMCVRQHAIQIPFGVVNIEGTRLTGIVEKPNYNFLINAGLYCFNPEVLNFIPSDDFFDMTSLFDKLIENGHKAGVFQWNGKWVDIGTIGDYQLICNETLTKLGIIPEKIIPENEK